jgi:uncharacterized repeat protein (TIGR03803 family)
MKSAAKCETLGARWRPAFAGTLSLLLAIGLGAVPSAHAQMMEKILHIFTGGSDGGNPYGGLIADAQENLYGTTLAGGAYGYGTVFKLDKNGDLKVLYNFTGGSDGANPYGGVIRDAQGNLYGTAAYGGNGPFPSGCGVVFKLTPSGEYSVLYTFQGGTDGSAPWAGLVRDAKGNLYGTTYYGGESDQGVVFKVDAKGNESVLLSLTGNTTAGLALTPAGDAYGSTIFGGAYSQGSVFRITPSRAETVLKNFTGFRNGGVPMAALIRDSSGNLYGTTSGGGTYRAGIVFKMDPRGVETVLYNFTGGVDGTANPESVLVRDAEGNLYGTTVSGGASGYGTVFEVDPSGKQTTLYNFTNSGGDGRKPTGSLVRDAAGNVYGTTEWGGDSQITGYGIVYKLTNR